MCYSAQASFIASGLLATIGIAAIMRARYHRSLILFATIPFLFAVQQSCEGIIWLTDARNPTGLLHTIAAHVYLYFAYLIWPLWTPFSVRCTEKNQQRKNIINSALFAGICLVLFAIVRMIQIGIWAHIVDHHIAYPSYGPGTTYNITTFLYTYAVITPLAVSSMRYTGLLAAAGLGSLILSLHRYPAHNISLWCFFAALISAGVFLVVHTEVKRRSKG